MTDYLGEFELNKIYCMDCLEGLKKIPDKSINLVLTDPPYGDNCSYGRMEKEIDNNENPLLNLQVLFNLQRVMKDNSVCYNFTNWKHYPFLTEFITKYTCFNIRMMIVLNKERFGMGYGFRNQHELILVLEKGKPTYNLNNFSNVLNFPIINHNIDTHPHEKPREIARNIIKHSSNEKDIVLDCFVGSGSFMVAAKELNRNFIGFEIDNNWVDLANKRLVQSSLFGQLNLMEVKKC